MTDPVYRMTSCEGKVAFDSWATAEAARRRGARRDRNRGVYHCGVCRKFHLGRNVGPSTRRPRPASEGAV